MCGLFGKSRQAWYEAGWQGEERIEEHALIIELVGMFRADMPRIGCHKLFYMLQQPFAEHKIEIGRDKFFDILRSYGLMLKKKRRKHTRTTFSDHWLRKYPNLIRELIPERPGQLWVSDITYLATSKGFSYLSLITDAYSRKVMGWCLSATLSHEGSLNALAMALSARPDTAGLFHHSDRGIQYCCKEYVRLLESRGVKISMTESGDPLENAIAERINGILKTEFGLGDRFSSIQVAEKSTERAIRIYNTRRPHASVDYLTPEEAEAKTGVLPKRWKSYYQGKAREEPALQADGF